MLQIKAPAKLNLHLRVFPKDSTGFHPIESIFHPIDLCDDIVISQIEGKNTCKILCEQMILPDQNTITKAYSLFCQETGITQSIQIDLTKKIMVGAGLGGGSSDGASVLMGLDAFFEAKLSEKKMYEIAGKIGSDVPFFLCKNSALVEGYGERLTPIKMRRDLYFLIIFPSVFSATPQAYQLLDNWMKIHSDTTQWPSREDLKKNYFEIPEKWQFTNSFTDPLCDFYSIIRKAICDIKDCGASYANLTGSGSAVFGVFSSFSDANTAYQALSNHWENCFLAKSQI
ncbi:MAG: 4-(cytidine 5'-diphospho)-2-C-methyl-D-erythritol kinase [Treponemataceae bacterium]